MKLSLIVASILVLTACHGDDPSPVVTAPSAAFDGADPVAGTTVFLRGRSLGNDGSQVVVDVVARGATDVHGAAFRLGFDPAVLSYVDVKRGEAFSSHALNVTKEAKPGELMAAWTETGGTGFSAVDETVLGTLTFDVKQHATTTTLEFRGERSTLIDRNGKAAALAWRGGSFAIR